MHILSTASPPTDRETCANIHPRGIHRCFVFDLHVKFTRFLTVKTKASSKRLFHNVHPHPCSLPIEGIRRRDGTKIEKVIITSKKKQLFYQIESKNKKKPCHSPTPNATASAKKGEEKRQLPPPSSLSGPTPDPTGIAYRNSSPTSRARLPNRPNKAPQQPEQGLQTLKKPPRKPVHYSKSVYSSAIKQAIHTV